MPGVRDIRCAFADPPHPPTRSPRSAQKPSSQHTHPISSAPASSRCQHGSISSKPVLSKSLHLMTPTGTTFVQVTTPIASTCPPLTVAFNGSCRRTPHIPSQRRRHWQTYKTTWWPQQTWQPPLAPRQRLRFRPTQDLPIPGEDRCPRADR